jgi:carbamoyl-phosphate synthase large subunit
MTILGIMMNLQYIKTNSNDTNILIFPGGTENGLEILNSLRYAKNINLFSASSNVPNHADFVYKKHFVIPDIYEDECLSHLNKIIKENDIDFIFPANSLIIDFLVENREKIKVKIFLTDSEIIKIVRSKKKTYKLYKNLIQVPKVFKLNSIDLFPVFIKPDMGYGSQGARIIRSKNEFDNLELDISQYVITEYLPGKEYTVDCFSTKKGGILFTSARERVRIRMGTSMRSVKAEDHIQALSKKIAEIIFSKLKIDGLWFFQLKYSKDNEPKLLEIEPRVAGTMGFSRALGVNLPLLYLHYLKGVQIKIPNIADYSAVLDRALKNRYKTNLNYNTVYIDLDDTIITKMKVNVEIISYLYQCINNSVKIVLITKSLENDLFSFLAKMKIKDIFDEIIWLKEEDSKANYIQEGNAIFIDDSFTQREEVRSKKGIAVFDPSMIEVLIENEM